METAADVGSSPASESLVAIEPTVIESHEPAAPSLDDDLRSIWDKDHPPRENGRFVAKNPTEQAADAPPVTEVADQTAKTAIEQAQPAIDAPASWSAEMKAKLASLPPEHADVIKYAAQRDRESHEAISRAGQQIKAFEPIGKVVEQFAHVFQNNGLQPHDGIARMLAVNEMLEQNPRAAIAQIAKAYGVDLSGEGTQEATPENARIAELEARLAKTESHLTAQERQRLAAERQREKEADDTLARDIATFANDPKNPRPHFQSVRLVMAGLISSGAVETMQEAYDRAVYADPTIRQSMIAEDQAKAEAKRKADDAERVKAAKKAAGVNVRSSPGQSSGHRTMEDDMRAIWQKNHGSA
jgi:hypothetical protein